MLTVQDVRDAVLREVGAGLEGQPDLVLSALLDKVTPFINVYWEMWTWKSQIYPGLQALYTKKSCLNVAAGQVRDLMPVTISSYSGQQTTIFNNLQKMVDACQKDIDRVEKEAQASRPVEIAQMNYAFTQSSMYGYRFGRASAAFQQPGNTQFGSS